MASVVPPPSPATVETGRLTLHLGLAFTLPFYPSRSLLLPLPISLASHITPGYLAILASFWIARPCNPPQTLLMTSSLLILGSASGSSQHRAFPGSLSLCHTQRSLFSSQNPFSVAYTPLSLAFQTLFFALCEISISEYCPARHQVEREKWSTLAATEQDGDLTLLPPLSLSWWWLKLTIGWFAWWTLWAAVSSALKHSPWEEHGGSVDSRNKQSTQGPASPKRERQDSQGSSPVRTGRHNC